MPGRNLKRAGTRFEYRLSSGTTSGAPDPWADVDPASVVSPLPAEWRIESLGAGGETIGISSNRRLVIVNAAR